MCVVHIFFNFTRASLSNTPICRHCFYTYLIYYEFYPHTISYKYIKNIAFFHLILHTTKVTFFFILLYELHNPIHTRKCTQYFNVYICIYILCMCILYMCMR